MFADRSDVYRTGVISASMSTMEQLWNFIGGERRPAVEGATTPVIDPVTAETYAQAPRSTGPDVEAAMAAAAQAFVDWRDRKSVV